ncbi:MAG: orotidine-5'-phosphate decarboxylase [Alloprevotella sp.]|nr:orotidine-5'-phosphate decarboxylase [Alloprevotella sp.]
MDRQYLIEQIRRRRSFLCVGLDTDLAKLPRPVLEQQDEEPLFAFNRAVIDATAPYCVAYKPNFAFYERFGLQGWQALERTVEYLRERCPDHFLIADAKRGDIGNTAAMYARGIYEEMGFHAATVAPYMGRDSVEPFLEYRDRWTVLLALTSNPGSRDFQFQPGADGGMLYESVLRRSQEWADEGQLMYVVGATQGERFREVRRLAPRHFLLVPGVGAQGGSLEDVCRHGMTQDCGLLVNSSRGIIYASQGDDFASAAGHAARELQEQMAGMMDKYM